MPGASNRSRDAHVAAARPRMRRPPRTMAADKSQRHADGDRAQCICLARVYASRPHDKVEFRAKRRDRIRETWLDNAHGASGVRSTGTESTPKETHTDRTQKTSSASSACVVEKPDETSRTRQAGRDKPGPRKLGELTSWMDERGSAIAIRLLGPTFFEKIVWISTNLCQRAVYRSCM